ncbi:MAG: hypothetical protein ABIA21_01055 [Candidatus Aenigmatarchaeota archaeon]
MKTKNGNNSVKISKTRIFRSRDPLKKALYKHGMHNCGGGYTGQIIKSKNLTFCGLCGRQFD